MYSTLPPVLVELISNSYDADAEEVTVEFSDDAKSIKVSDDGHGMSQKEINENFLIIGRNRRKAGKDNDVSPKKKRKVTGRKGIGKLAIFGIAHTMQIESVREKKKNVLRVDYKKMLESEGDYHPESICDNEYNPAFRDGTSITMTNIQRKTKFDIESTAKSLASRLNFFDEGDFSITLKSDNGESITINKSYKESLLKYEFRWELKELIENTSNGDREHLALFMNEKGITGYIASTEKPIAKEKCGLILFARGKLVNTKDFYGLTTSNNYAYSYLTGELHVDYIDDMKEDLISTSRDSLMWSDSRLGELRRFLQSVIKIAVTEWNKFRKEANRKRIDKTLPVSIDKWLKKLSLHERNLANKIINSIVGAENLEGEQIKGLIEYVQAAFEFESFKQFAEDLSNTKLEMPEVLQLMQEWEYVEAKEMYRICIGRITTINKLKEYIDADTPEKDKEKSMHEFLKKFPWLLEPRANEIKDEVRYSSMLAEKFPEKELDEKNRRVDFICSGFGDTLYIIEIKRSQKMINKKDIRQLEDYLDFIKGKGLSEYNIFSGIIIGKGLADNTDSRGARERAEKNRIYVKSYSEVLHQVEKYHQEFLDRYNELQKVSSQKKKGAD